MNNTNQKKKKKNPEEEESRNNGISKAMKEKIELTKSYIESNINFVKIHSYKFFFHKLLNFLGRKKKKI